MEVERRGLGIGIPLRQKGKSAMLCGPNIRIEEETPKKDGVNKKSTSVGVRTSNPIKYCPNKIFPNT